MHCLFCLFLNLSSYLHMCISCISGNKWSLMADKGRTCFFPIFIKMEGSLSIMTFPTVFMVIKSILVSKTYKFIFLIQITSQKEKNSESLKIIKTLDKHWYR